MNSTCNATRENSLNTTCPPIAKTNRYQAVFAKFNAVLKRLDDKAWGKIMSQIESDCMADARRCSKQMLKPSQDNHALPTTIHQWLSKPLEYSSGAHTLFKQLQGQIACAPGGGELEAAIASVSDIYTAITEKMLTPPSTVHNVMSGESETIYQKLCDKKFKNLSPALYAHTRYFVGAWKVRQVKTKKTGFLARFDDPDENTGTAADLHSKYRKAGAECKLYIFNDSLLISRKRAGTRVCLHFAALHDVEIIQPDGTLDVFGLSMVPTQSEEQQVCHVFKGGEASDNTIDFIAALRMEIAMASFRRRSEVVLPHGQSWNPTK